MYHAVSQVQDELKHICVSPKRFEAQMLYLKRRGLRGVSVHELLRAMSAGNASKLIGLTFDDGYENFLQAALPVLRRCGFSATMFVVTKGMLSGENIWDQTSRIKLLGVDGVREVAKQGIEIGAHSMSHTRLSDALEPEALEREIVHSREILSETLGREIQGFCYPYGDMNDRVRHRVQQAGYAYACGASAWKGIVQGSTYNLPRVHVGYRDGDFRLRAKLYAYSQYARIPSTWATKIAHPTVRRFGSRIWFGW